MSQEAEKVPVKPPSEKTPMGHDVTEADPPNADPADTDLPGLPQLHYNILGSRLKLAAIVFLLVAEASLMPIGLYYGLVLGTTLRPGLVFAVITSFFGIVSGIEFGLRCLKLILKGDKYRPAGGTKWSFDFTHWTLSFGYTFMSAILIGASIPYDPPVRPLAIPVSLFLIQVGVQLVWSGWMHRTGRPAPFKISSVPKGGKVPPFVLTAVEDIIGVDGDGGRVYRDALLARYEASPRFRRMIVQQNWLWAVGSLLAGIGTLVVVWTVPERVAYGVGWGSPLVFTIIWSAICIVWVRRSLRLEKEAWRREHAGKNWKDADKQQTEDVSEKASEGITKPEDESGK